MQNGGSGLNNFNLGQKLIPLDEENYRRGKHSGLSHNKPESS